MHTFFRGPITGRKFFAIFFSFFFVIVSVNLVLAFQAVATFPGVEVKNSYVASQNFDRTRAAQVALGWEVDAAVRDGELQLRIVNADGAPVPVADLAGIFGHATSVRDDQVPQFVFDGAVYRAPVITSPGNWNLRFTATASDGTPFQQRVIVLVD